MDPEAPENQAAVVMSFVNQAAPDIKKKLQKLEDLEGKNCQNSGTRQRGDTPGTYWEVDLTEVKTGK